MRNSFGFSVAVLALIALADEARAEPINLGKRSFDEVYSACKNVNGDFTPATSKDGGGYKCVKQNCDGQGGKCSVTCDEKQNCTGDVPGRATPPPGRYDLVKILKVSPAGPPGRGVLESSPGASPHGPSGVGTPKPAAPGGKLY